MKTDLKVLTIGNSFTWSLEPYFKQAAESAGCTLKLQFANHGGCELHRHWEYIANEERDREYSMYDGKKMRELLTADQWDVVTIQQGSHASWRPETFQPFADNIIGFVRSVCPKAEIMIQQTWAYRADDPRIMPGGEWNIDQQEMYNRLTKNYSDLAAHQGLRMIPTGFAVQLARKEMPVKFKNYDPALLSTLTWPDFPPQANEIVGKMYWCKDKKTGKLFISRDSIHLNERGRYLQACVWFAFLYGHSAGEITFVPDIIADEDAAWLRQIAQRAVNEFPQVVK